MSQSGPKQDLTDTSPLGRSSDRAGETVPVSSGDSRITNPSSASSVAGNFEATEGVLQEIAKGGTNVDSLVGRLVIDNGLATSEEVRLALGMAKSPQTGEDNSKS